MVYEEIIKLVQIKDNQFKVWVKEKEPNKYTGFWHLVNTGKWEPHIFELLKKYLSPNNTYIDVGSWIGPTLLYAAKYARKAYGIEPDSKAFDQLEKNILLNPQLMHKIELLKGALWGAEVVKKLGVGLYGKTLGDSASSLIHQQMAEEEAVQCITFNAFIKRFKIADCNFIKIDTEGSEVSILGSMGQFIREKKPHLYVSFHCGYYSKYNMDIQHLVDTLKPYPHAMVVGATNHNYGQNISLDYFLKNIVPRGETCDLFFEGEVLKK